LGGGLIAVAGWQSLFLLNVPLGLLALSLAWRYLPPDQKAGKAGFDLQGALALAMAVAVYALAMTGSGGGFGVMNALLLGFALVAGAMFLRRQAKAASPLIRLDLFRQRVLSAGVATNALVATVMMTTLVVGPFYLAGALGLSPARVGLAMPCGPLVAALAGVPAGRCVDAYGAQRTMLVGLMAMIAGTALLSLAFRKAGIAGYVAPLSVLTAGYALFQAANNSAVMAGVGSTQRGAVAGVLNLSRNLGLITGASLMGAVFAFGAGGRRPGCRTARRVGGRHGLDVPRGGGVAGCGVDCGRCGGQAPGSGRIGRPRPQGRPVVQARPKPGQIMECPLFLAARMSLHSVTHKSARMAADSAGQIRK